MAHLMHAQPPQLQAPYSGQWTKEEQEYVACLQEGFKCGTLDIPDGTSLRFFIAAKLGCKPKRVSKKYERSGYNGKQVYRRDTNVSFADLEAYRQRLKDSEKAFKESRALVVSMQEAKTDSKPSNSHIITETPVISLHSNANANASAQAAALEDRLQAMRSQIDRRTTNLLGYPTATSRFNTGMMGAGGATGTGMSPQVLQAMMLQRQRAAALQGAAGFSTGFPSAGLSNGATTSGLPTPAGPANKLLIDLYQRRQQLIMSYMGGAGAPPGSSMPSMMGGVNALGRTSPLGGMGYSSSPLMGTKNDAFATLSPLAGDKRDLDEAVQEQARKRARAA